MSSQDDASVPTRQTQVAFMEIVTNRCPVKVQVKRPSMQTRSRVC